MMALCRRIWLYRVIPAETHLNIEEASCHHADVPLPADGEPLLPPAELKQHLDWLTVQMRFAAVDVPTEDHLDII
jgi:hypothetical protein